MLRVQHQRVGARQSHGKDLVSRTQVPDCSGPVQPDLSPDRQRRYMRFHLGLGARYGQADLQVGRFVSTTDLRLLSPSNRHLHRGERRFGTGDEKAKRKSALDSHSVVNERAYLAQELEEQLNQVVHAHIAFPPRGAPRPMRYAPGFVDRSALVCCQIGPPFRIDEAQMR